VFKRVSIKYISLAFLCPVLIVMQINSTAWFRTGLADYYKDKGQYARAIGLYNEILTKDSVKKGLDDKAFSEVNLKMGALYARLGLRNLAIESYAMAALRSPDLGYSDKDRLFAIGVFEARALSSGTKDSLFAAGDAYIKDGSYDEARAFFTKRILDYGANPFEVLVYLQERYGRQKGVRQAVWGRQIYVVLEDFEDLKPRLGEYLGASRVNNHYIAQDFVYKGRYSEFLDVTCPDPARSGSNYWVINTRIPLKDDGLRLGIRIAVRKTKPQACELGINVRYSGDGISDVFPKPVRQDLGGGWEEISIEDFLPRVKGVASRYRWSTGDMVIDKIIFDTMGNNNKFYVDNIELYIVN